MMRSIGYKLDNNNNIIISHDMVSVESILWHTFGSGESFNIFGSQIQACALLLLPQGLRYGEAWGDFVKPHTRPARCILLLFAPYLEPFVDLSISASQFLTRLVRYRYTTISLLHALFQKHVILILFIVQKHVIQYFGVSFPAPCRRRGYTRCRRTCVCPSL